MDTRTAVISDDGRFRYQLTRTWDAGLTPAIFIMLNPSTADAETDDPTIRRCIDFARRAACGGLIVVNLYAYRSADPANLRTAIDPFGPDNDTALAEAFEKAAMWGIPVIAAWGAKADPARVRQVRRLLRGLKVLCLGLTASGQPKHPLYIRADQPLVEWISSDGEVVAR